MRHTALALLFAAFSSLAFAQAPAYQPETFQQGKDVVWVPTPQVVVDKMLDMAKVTAADYVMDLGSGDGRTVITAAKRGAVALGVEYNPDMVELSKRNAEKEGVSARASFMKADETADLFRNAGCGTSWCTALLWIVPARVEGSYKTPQGELTLKQTFQNLSGTLTSGGASFPLEGKVRGEDISFTVQGRNYTARMNGKNLELR